jgi:hypothetical protein
VSAKFHVIGEGSEWFRVRVMEEVYSHGLEGSVLLAGEKTLVVVVEGDKSRIKRLYSDLSEFCPKGVECTDLVFSLQKSSEVRIIRPGEHADHQTLDYILQYLKEIEKATQRIDQKINALTAILEGTAGAEILSRSRRRMITGETAGEKDMEVEEEATSGFASMFSE